MTNVFSGCSWLFESARTGERAPEEQFLIDGATSAPKSNQQPEKETEKCMFLLDLLILETYVFTQNYLKICELLMVE